ncbi:MAG TPA: aminotransferase class V-fold PLP-dependent enzyme [Gemmatimonadaceae bacterium]|nr:aminotransferase class V-fold PLP-dependent enzyme [Gemmatimonadaceae bacterium]
MIDELRDLRAREFPWASRGDQIFLNHASTGPLPQRAVDTLKELSALRAEPWRYSQELQFGTLAKARAGCARLINANASEIALMVNTSYGLNLAARALPFDAGDVVITSDREYPSNIYPWMEMEVSRGITLRRIPCDGVLPDEEAIMAALDAPRVRAVVLSWVSFATGYRIDVARIGGACRERGIWFILDAIQGVGSIPLDVREVQVDVVACGAQKWLLSPWGTGFVWLRPDLVQTLRPVDVSWMSTKCSDDFTRLTDYDFTYREDARRFEVITLPYQDFGGMNASLDLFLEVGPDQVYAQVDRLTTRIVRAALGTPGLRLVTPPAREHRGGIVAVAPRDPVAASARLTAAGVTHSLREQAIRLSPHFYNTDDEIDRMLALLAND